ncbi:MAG: dihydroxyacetone kinase subunit DhaK [Allorhizobium sp.]
MNKFMDAAETMVAESLEGFVAAHTDLLMFGPDRTCICRRQMTPGKVGLVSGGGAGHEPMHTGFVGFGMLDAACTGHVFTSPTPDQIVCAIQQADTGTGCLLIVKNYDGDVMNFEMAAEMAAVDHEIALLFVGDDISDPHSRPSDRRGVAGTVLIEKLLGAAAESGMTLPELLSFGQDLMTRIFSIGVALRGARVPQLRHPTFALAPGEMEVGIGIHGEPGCARVTFEGAEATARMMCDHILAASGPSLGGHGLLLINGFGATPLAELYLMHGHVRRMLVEAGVTIERSLVGTFATSLDMAGLSATLARLSEAELSLWDAPVHTAALRWP